LEFDCVTGDLTSGLNENTAIAGFSVAPNPSNGLFTLTLDATNAKGFSCKVMSLTGQLLLETAVTDSTFTIDLREFGTGVYMLVLENETTSLKQRVVVE
jgi:hypothetical protein